MYVYGINQSHPITLIYKTIPNHPKPDQTRNQPNQTPSKPKGNTKWPNSGARRKQKQNTLDITKAKQTIILKIKEEGYSFSSTCCVGVDDGGKDTS